MRQLEASKEEEGENSLWTKSEAAAEPRSPRTFCPCRTQSRHWQESIPKSETAEGREPRNG